MTDYIVYTFYGLCVLTKEIADDEELIDEFGCIPDGIVEDRGRYMTCVKITRNNRRKFLEDEKDLSFSETVPNFDTFSNDVKKRFRYEWSERSW